MDALTMAATDVEALGEAEAKEVLGAWVKARRPELPTALAESASKLHARLAKKALYQLASSGVAVESRRAAEPAAPAAPAAQPGDDFPCALSAVLGTGERAVFFARPLRGGGVEVFQGVMSDEQGVLQLERAETNRDQYRRRMRELKRSKEVRVQLVTWDRMRLELGRALFLNARANNPLNPEADQHLRRMGVDPQEPDFAVPLPEAGDEAQAPGAAALFDTKEVAQWLPSEAWLHALNERLQQAVPEGTPEADAAAARITVATTVADEHQATPARQLYARRLWLMAEVFDATERPEAAGWCRAEARTAFHGQAPSAFGRRFFTRVLELSRPA